MIKETLIAVQDALKKITELRYIAEDWGQLDNFEMSPVQFPCALIDFSGADYASIGGNAQTADATLSVRVAQIQVQNSTNAPNANINFESYDLITKINTKLHGSHALTRISCRKTDRDDVIKEIVLTYKFGFKDVATKKEYKKLSDVGIGIEA